MGEDTNLRIIRNLLEEKKRLHNLAMNRSELLQANFIEKELKESVLPSPLSHFSFRNVNPLSKKTFVDIHGNTMESDFVLRDKEVIAVYFSCSFCPENMNVIPLLNKIHKRAESSLKPFEIIYANYDENRYDMMEDFQKHHGDWFAIEFDEPIRMALRYMYSIVSVPQMIVLDPNGGVITWRGLQEIKTHGVNVLITWFD